MATAAALVPLEVYLDKSYEPDVDYDDGVLIERNVGKRRHGRLQILIGTLITNHAREWRIKGFTEMRIKVGHRKFCVADICAVPVPSKEEDILTDPPLFTIEILSPSDTFRDVTDKARKYLAMGIPYVWTADPEGGRCWRHDN